MEAKDVFWRALNAAIRDVPRGVKLVVVMNANARTGGRVAETAPKVLGAYGRDTLNGNDRRLLGLAADNQQALVSTFFPKNGVSHTFQQANKSKLQHRLGYLLPQFSNRAVDMCMASRFAVSTPRTRDHNLVFVHIGLGVRVAPNRSRRDREWTDQHRPQAPESRDRCAEGVQGEGLVYYRPNRPR